jgi:hypothetical protein
MALTDDLAVFYPLDEASGSAIDAHASSDLAESGGTIDTGTGPDGSGARDFERADTEQFNKSDDADLSVADIDFSISFWFKPESVGIVQVMFSKGNTTTAANIAYYGDLNASNRLRFLVGNGAGSSTTFTDSTFGAVSAGTWYHAVFVHDSVNNLLKMAINANTFQTTACSHGSFNDAGFFILGGITTSFGSDYDGMMQRWGLWKRALSQTECTDLYNGGNGLSYAAMSGGAPAGQPTGRRWGGVPHMGGHGYMGKGYSGRMWGHSRSGRVIVPAWISDRKAA